MSINANMKTSANGLDFTTHAEGFERKAYRDTGGVLTIGVGHVILPHEHHLRDATLTDEQIRRLLANDITVAENTVKRMVTVKLNQNQFDVLVDFVFNVGAAKFRSSTLLKKLNAGDYKGAADELNRWVYDEGKVQPGLVNRRREGRALFLTGKWKKW